MAQLADALAYTNAKEIERNEQALAACFPPPAINLTEDAQAKLSPFLHWCGERGVRGCPAQPTTVAAFVQWNIDQGVTTDKILDALAAIEAPNPVATQVVGDLLNGLIKVDAPRSWTKEEKILFALLPPHAKVPIARRGREREIEICRLHNKTAEELKRQSDSAETKPVILEQKETTDV